MTIFWQLIKSAFTSLAVNKLRTFLTILGIVIGIMSVITLLDLGQAAQAEITNSISSIGSNLITIIPGQLRSGSGINIGSLTSTSFTMSDVDALINAPKYFVSGVATQSSSVAKVQYDGNIENISVIGIYGDYWNVRSIEVAQGQPITDRDITAMSKVAIVGPELTTDLFNGESPIGKKIKINNQNFTVIGITKAVGSNGFTNPDTMVTIPLTTMQKFITGNEKVSQMFATSKDSNTTTAAQNELETILRQAHNLKPGDASDFTIRSASQALSIIDTITGVLTAFLAAIGAISLLVGGIGIMNIMFVTVNERTKEIGLRKALGATKNDILLQFLAEAIVVTLLGGVLGTAMGVGLTYIICSIASLPFTVSTASIVLAVGVSATIGLVFGIYPAWKAAQLSPIDALRYE